MQRKMLGLGIGLGMILAGCGSSVPSAVPEAAPEAAPAAPTASSARSVQPDDAGLRIVPAVHHDATSRDAATRSLVITFQNPRTSFSSEKIDLNTGKTLPADDGMGPDGDISFFFDGSRFQVIANSGGGANRTLAPAESGKPVGEFAMAPIPLQEGSEVLVKQDHGVYTIRITGLDAGSMAFSPTGSGTGTGSVTFAYHRQSSAPVSSI